MENSWNQVRSGFSQYLLSCGRSPTTADTYCSNLSIFWRFCGKYEATPYEADRQIVRTFVSERLGIVSKARAHNDLAALRSFYRWLKEGRYREDDPTEDVRVKRTKQLPTEPLKIQELNAMLTVCTRERDRLLLLMLAYSGLRISELAELRAENFDWQQGLIRIRGKGDKERLIAPSPDVLGRLHAFLGMFATGPIWLSKVQRRQLSAQQIRKIIYEVAERAKVCNVHPHRFRAFFATQYVEQFADIQALQGMLGHSSLETTARYSEWTKQKRGIEQMKRFKIGA